MGGLMGGGKSGGSAPTQPIPTSWGGQPNYIPMSQPKVDKQLTGYMTSMGQGASGIANSIVPSLSNYASAFQSNPYGAQAQSGANAASAYGTGTLAPMEQTAAANLYNMSNSSVPYATSILNTGFDPQNALYNQQLNQLTQQMNAANAMSGVTGPAAAGVLDQGLTNFNLGWQNNQLNRQIAAAGGYDAMLQGVGQGYSGAADLGNAAMSTIPGASMLPYSTYMSMLSSPLSGLGQVAQVGGAAYGPMQSTIGDLGNYLGLGTSASSQFNNALSNAYSNNINAYQAQLAGNQQTSQGLGSLLGAFGGGGGGFGGLFGGGAGSSLFDLGGLFGGAGAAGGMAGGGDLVDIAAMAALA